MIDKADARRHPKAQLIALAVVLISGQVLFHILLNLSIGYWGAIEKTTLQQA